MSTKNSFIKDKLFVCSIVCTILLFTNIFMASLSFASTSSTSNNKFNMSYIYFGDTASYINSINNTKNSINEISPSYFDLNTNGTLKITSKIDKAFIDEMHNRNIEVVPFLSNHWDRNLGRIALNNRIELVNQIVSAVNEYNFDGVNVDLENLTEQDRNLYVEFVKLLKEKLPEDKIVAVAVAANPKGINSGWQGSYDYKALGEHSDYIMIMTYDEHYQGGTVGPVASYGFVEQSIKYALKYVPKEKLVLGIPFFGRIWRQGGGILGQGISLTTVETLISKYRGITAFDSGYLSPNAVITIKPQDEKPYVFGRKLEAGTYTIWYENEASIKYKLDLVNKYDLKGTGSWSLGQETLNTWDYYDLWLNGHHFHDAQGHWAVKHIIYVANKGWMIGDGKTSFDPNKSLTRAEAVTALVRSLGLKELRAKSNNTSTFGNTFSDINGHWAENEIKIAAQHEIILGRGDNTFGPNSGITREELAVMMDRLLTSKEIVGSRETLASRGEIERFYNEARVNELDNFQPRYLDVSIENCTWSYHSIIKMTQMGILTGAPNGNFMPKNYASRAEMAALLSRTIN